MPPKLLTLPVELRDRIYELILCSQGPAYILPPSMRSWQTPGGRNFERSRHDVAVEPKYPPKNTVESVEPVGPLEPTKQAEGGADEDEDEDWETVSDADSLVGADDATKGRDVYRTTSFDHFLLRNERKPAENNLWQYGLFFRNGKLTVGPNPDEGEFDEYSSDDDGEGESSDEDRPGRPSRRPYPMEACRPFDLALLRVSRQINTEATPVFYGGVHFVPDGHPVQALRFFAALPDRALQSITTLAINNHQLMGDDGPSYECWSGQASSPLNKGCPAMATPMGAFLATSMPKLAEVYLYIPLYGDEHWYCSWAPDELCRLLCHGKIRRLHYVFMGSDVAKALRQKADAGSVACLERLTDGGMESLGRRTANAEFEAFSPMPKLPHSRSHEEHERHSEKFFDWEDKRAAYARAHSKLFGWKWGDRDVSMGSSGPAQAVLTTWLK